MPLCYGNLPLFHQKVEPFLSHLILGGSCDLFWPRECGRSDTVWFPGQGFRIPCNFCFYLLGTISLPCKEAQPSLVNDERPPRKATWRRTEAPLKEFQGHRYGGEAVLNIPAPVELPQQLPCETKLYPLSPAQIPDPQIISNNIFGCFLKPLSFRIACYIQQVTETLGGGVGRPVWIIKMSEFFKFEKKHILILLNIHSDF